jgi:hypothetical protein
MRMFKLVLPAAILMAGFVLWTSASYGKPEYAKKENQKCTFCHSKIGAPDAMKKDPALTDAGKYYSDHKHSLDGYKPPAK